MESFFTRYKNALVLMLVVLAQVILLAMQVRRPAPNMQDGHNIRLWRYWVAGLVTPPEKLAHGVGLKVRGVWSNYIYLRNLREQNESLQEENTRLRLEQASLAEDAREGQRLREILDFRAAYIDTTVPAQVIGTSGTDQAHVIYIDKGSKDGIRPQMPVITPDGVVGKVKNVFPGTSQVLLISDQTSGAGVMLQTTRIRGVMKGNVSGEPQMINISPDERIQPGELVLTSGGDQVYPRGLPVGVVDRVVPDPDTSYVNVVVKPNANLSKLEEVMVITAVSDKMPFGQEKDVMQSEVDAYSEKERAADVLSEKLPSLRDAETAESKLAGVDSGSASGTAGGDASGEAPASSGGGDPARPMRPPQPLHPDRYTPGAAPAAADLTPGEGAPVKYPAASLSEAAAPKAAKSTGSSGGSSGASTMATETGTAPKSRFPAKPNAVTAPAAAGVASAGTEPTSVAKTPSGVAATTGTATAVGTSNGTAKPVSRIPGTEFSYPLQPVYSRTPKPAVAPSASEGSAATSPISGPTAKTPRTVAGNGIASPVSSSASVAGTGAAGIRTAGAASGSTSSSGSAAASRKIVIPSDSGGILTPAGMGAIMAAPRARPPAAATGTTTGVAGAAGTHSGATARPAAPNASTSGAGATGNGKPSAARPQTASPQIAPSRPPSTAPQAVPPGGL